MTLIAVKLLLAPSFVVGASLASRRFGVRVGGLIAGLPVVAGPILLVYALEHGRLFGGLISGFGAFALFCFTLSISLRTLDIASAFALATALALLTQSATLALTRGEPASEAPPASDALPEY